MTGKESSGLCGACHGGRIGPSRDQPFSIGKSFRASGQGLDQEGAERINALHACRVMDLISQFMGIFCQAEILFPACDRMPDELVCFCDDPVIGIFPVGMLSVEPGAYRLFGISGQ